MTQTTGTRKIIQLVSIAGVSIVSLGLSVLLGLWRFNRLVKRNVEALLAQATTAPEGEVVTEEMLKELPEPVQRYLRYTGIVGKPLVDTVRLRQKGAMYLGSKRGWIRPGFGGRPT